MNKSMCRASFSFIGRSFDLDEVTQRMDFLPTESNFEQRIVSAHCPAQLDIAGYAFEKFILTDINHEIETSWSICTKKRELNDINEVLFELLEILVPRKEIIQQIMENYALSTVIHFNIDAGDDGISGMYLLPSAISFINEIHASISFDIST